MSNENKECRVGSQSIFAAVWERNGDHPADSTETFIHSETGVPFKGEGKVVRYYRHPSLNANVVCPHCGRIMHDHGWIDCGEDGRVVCPGDWIVEICGCAYFPMKPDLFTALYSPNMHWAPKTERRESSAWHKLTSVTSLKGLAKWIYTLSGHEKNRLLYEVGMRMRYGDKHCELINEFTTDELEVALKKRKAEIATHEG
jgi:hypothetical protein